MIASTAVRAKRSLGTWAVPRLRSGLAVRGLVLAVRGLVLAVLGLVLAVFGLALAVLGLALATPAHAQSERPPAPYAYTQLVDSRQEAEATALMQTLRCLVCQGQSIADSDADMAGDMRHLVRSRIAAGESPDQVRGWLIARYGSWVSYQPALSGSTLLLWLVPLVLLLGGGALALRRFKRRR